MQNFIITLLICSATMSALALFYMAITPLLSKRYSVASCYYIWLVIVMGLIIPFRPQFSNAIVKVDMPSNTVMPNIQVGNGTPVTAPFDNILPSALPTISLWQIAAVVWLVGMIVFLAYYVVKHCRFLKLVARWSKEITDEQTLTLMQSLKAQMGLSKNISLQFCDSIGSPMMIGFVNPCILLPKTDFAKDELSFILKHELVHYQRKDLWYKCLVLIATAIHWFNPIVYLMAKAIDIQCELSCDEKVVRDTNADTRLFYSETIIGVVRHKSKLKTSLSTNFYGGKKGMKKRIFSIMDMSKKKVGLTVLCGALILTLGTGFTFAVNAQTQGLPENIQENIKEDITVSPNLSFAYGFLPDPAIYSQYSSFGIAISDDGKMLIYNGQRVRLFVDEHSEDEAFFWDGAGAVDLSVIRNAAGTITGIDSLSEAKAQEYRYAFFADDINTTTNTQNTTAKNKYEQYSAFGIVLSSNGEILQYNGQRVKLFVDMLSDGSFETFWADEAGTINLSVVRNSTGKITAIESISSEKAQEYNLAAKEYEQNTLNGLDEKIAERLKALYPEN